MAAWNKDGWVRNSIVANRALSRSNVLAYSHSHSLTGIVLWLSKAAYSKSRVMRYLTHLEVAAGSLDTLNDLRTQAFRKLK